MTWPSTAQTNRQTSRQCLSQTPKHVDRQKDRRLDRQTDRQTGKKSKMNELRGMHWRGLVKNIGKKLKYCGGEKGCNNWWNHRLFSFYFGQCARTAPLQSTPMEKCKRTNYISSGNLSLWSHSNSKRENKLRCKLEESSLLFNSDTWHRKQLQDVKFWNTVFSS